MQNLILCKEDMLLETLHGAMIPVPKALDFVLEIKAEGGNEAKLGVVLLHSGIVVISDAIDDVPVVSVLEVFFVSEVVVGLSITLHDCITVGSVPCLVVGLVFDSVVGLSEAVMPGTKT